MKASDLILEEITQEFNKLIDFDVSVLALTPPSENYIETSILIEGIPQHPKIFYDSIFHSFQLMDGFVFLNTKQKVDEDIMLSECLVDNGKKVRTSIIIPIKHKLFGTGVLLIGSYFTNLLRERYKIETININDVITKSYEKSDVRQKKNEMNPDNNHYYQMLFNSLPNPALVVDNLGNIIHATHSFEKYSGYKWAEINNRMTIENFFNELNLEQIILQIQLSTDREIQFESKFITKNCEERVLNCCVKTLPNINEFILNFTDITEYITSNVDILESYDKITAAMNFINQINVIEFDQLVENIYKLCREYIECDYAFIVYVDNDKKELQIFTYDYPKETIEKKTQFTRINEFIHYLQTISETKVSMSEMFHVIDVPFTNMYQSELCIKLTNRNECVGALCFASELDRAFTEFHFDVFTDISNHIASVLRQSDILKKINNSNQKNIHLYKMLTRLDGSLLHDDIAESIINSVTDITGAHSCTLTFIEDDHNSNLKLVHQFESVFNEKQPYYIENLSRSALRKFLAAKKNNAKSCCLIPIFINEKPFALVNIFYETRHTFSSMEKELLSALAKHTTTAITKTKSMQSLVLQKHFMEQIIECVHDAIIVLKADGMITRCNKSTEQIFGYSKEELIGTSMKNLLINWDLIINNLHTVLSSDHCISNIDTACVTKSASLIPMEWRFSHLKDERSNTISFIGIGRDISEKKRTANEFKSSLEELENLMYTVTHNLKTPLVSQEGFVNLLLDEYQSNFSGDALHYLNRIEQNAQYMRKMLSDLLLYYKIPKKEPQSVEINTTALVASIINDLANKDINFIISEKLPIVYFNEDELRIIFTNLINNSAKYMGVNNHPQIEIDCEEKKHGYEFYVKDNGVGVDPKYHQKIFNLFFRITNGNDVEGTGIGLSIVKRIVEKNDGRINIESAPGEGTTISFSVLKKLRGLTD